MHLYILMKVSIACQSLCDDFFTIVTLSAMSENLKVSTRSAWIDYDRKHLRYKLCDKTNTN
jgi:Tfp pilus assembly protein PilZ